VLIASLAAGYLVWSRIPARPPAGDPRASDPLEGMTAEEAFARGVELGKAGHHQASLPYFRRAASLAPDSWTARENYANTLYDGAQESRSHLGKFEPVMRSSVERMEMIATSFRETDAAAALAGEPTDRAIVLYQLGQSFGTFGFPIDALVAFEKAAALDPASAPIGAAVRVSETRLRAGGIP
jgi:tetratricopeptide (TPR) repeat protein